jgi:hypothetical protein
MDSYPLTHTQSDHYNTSEDVMMSTKLSYPILFYIFPTYDVL